MAAPITAGSLCLAALKNAGWAGQPLASLVIYLHINTEHIPVLRDLVVVVIVNLMCHYKRLCNIEVQAATSQTVDRAESSDIRSKNDWIWRRETYNILAGVGRGVVVGQNRGSL